MMKTLGERIRELREEQDLSLRELAGKVGVSDAFMSDVELNRRYPSDKHLRAIARHLKAALEDLKEYDTRPPVQELRKAALSDPQYGYAAYTSCSPCRRRLWKKGCRPSSAGSYGPQADFSGPETDEGPSRPFPGNRTEKGECHADPTEIHRNSASQEPF